MESTSEWQTGLDAWAEFIKAHPELGYHTGLWQFHNFLRLHRSSLEGADAIRKARGRHWIAHRARFTRAAFDCATGALKAPAVTGGAA
jgi:hypothetical protein